LYCQMWFLTIVSKNFHPMSYVGAKLLLLSEKEK
jgi:hypothetical protein